MAKLIKFEASWCQPCRQLTKTMNSMDIKIPVEHVNIDDQTHLAVEYGVRSIPTMVLLDEHNTALRRIQGAQTKEQIQEFLGEYA